MGSLTITIPACTGCCDPCKALGPTLAVVGSGIVSCGCLLSGTNVSVLSTIVSGINGAFEALVYDVDNHLWSVPEIGIINVKTFFPTIGLADCGAPLETDTNYYCALAFECLTGPDVAHIFRPILYGDASGYPPPPYSGLSGAIGFAAVAYVDLDEPAVNQFPCSPGGLVGVGGGTYTISLP